MFLNYNNDHLLEIILKYIEKEIKEDIKNSNLSYDFIAKQRHKTFLIK